MADSIGSSAAATRRSSFRRQSRPGSSASRPRTAGSRPSTGRPTTGASTNGDQSSYVVAVLEGRGVAREIGMAALDKATGRCVLFQVTSPSIHSNIPDCQTYVKTLHHLQLHNPSAILVPDTFMPMKASTKHKSSLLVDTMQEEFGDDGMTEFIPVARKYWNDQNGLEAINRLIVNDGEKAGTLVAVSNQYYALSAAGALFKYVETKMNTIFAPHSLRISFRCAEGTMMIDCETARNLELVQSNTARKSKNSLFGLLNHTYTPMAHRLLRVNILAPITSQEAIDRRLDVVQELVNDEEKYTVIRDALKTIKKIDLDKLIAQLTTSENRPVGGTTGNAKGASARVEQMIDLRNVIRSLPGVVKALQGCRSSLLCMISNMLDDERVKSIDEVVSQGLNDDAISAGGGGGFGGGSFGAITKKVYAVRANFNRFLDVARETYRENVTDIIDLQNELTKEHGLPLGLQYQENGFVFTLKKGDAPEGGKLPAPFINVSAKKNQKWTFSHLELKKRNARLRDSLDEALILSDQIVKALVEKIIEDVGVLYKASEAIALMDMLWAFVHTSILHNYTRPEFTGTLAIKAGRHPVLETIQAAGNFVPNDTYACDGSCFQIVEGPNMSGKSTYLRQVGVLVVLAMCGCFVPAEYASFRIHDALLTRLSNDDDPERSLSTFAKEMMTSSMILSVATNNSLILIDELGRGTSPIEGVGLAHAIAEEIIKIRQLTQTLSKYPTVVNLHLAVEKSTRADQGAFRLKFRHLLVDGKANTIDHYGIQPPSPAKPLVLSTLLPGLELARLADLPSSVLAVARGVSTKLKAQDDARQAASESNAIAARRKILLRLRVQLQQALEHSALDDDALLKYLEGIQRDTVLALKDLLPVESIGNSNARPSEPGSGVEYPLSDGTPMDEGQ
ncbi:MutS protein msh4 [Ceratobasidium sp. 395]|nr:MutS protein msh4 [Ceratobasidium sp. 395]